MLAAQLTREDTIKIACTLESIEENTYSTHTTRLDTLCVNSFVVVVVVCNRVFGESAGIL